MGGCCKQRRAHGSQYLPWANEILLAVVEVTENYQLYSACSPSPRTGNTYALNNREADPTTFVKEPMNCGLSEPGRPCPRLHTALAGAFYPIHQGHHLL